MRSSSWFREGPHDGEVKVGPQRGHLNLTKKAPAVQKDSRGLLHT